MPDSVRTALAFLRDLHVSDPVKATVHFSPAMREAVTDQALLATWERIQQLYGKPVRHTATRTAKTMTGEAEIVYLAWDFEKERVDTRVTVSSANQIVGVSFEVPVIR